MTVDGMHSLPHIDSPPDSNQSPVQGNPESEIPEYFQWKATATRVLGGMLLVLFSPAILLLMLLVSLTSAGHGLYRQKRVGKRGQTFVMYKLRTMSRDAETATGPTWCQPGDSRITFVGRMLRYLHLDELPQLLNIARGEMDLIGPRPERPEFVEKLVEEIPGYAERLAVLPGVTGLAQINLPPDETTDCVRRKLVLDIEYIQTATLGLDFRILLCTALRMMGVRHGHAVRLFRLNRQTPLIESQTNVSEFDERETDPSIGLSNGYHQNENGKIPTPHVRSASTAPSRENRPVSTPRNPK